MSDRIYSALLRLYPRPFREEYGEEMRAAFRDMREHRRSTPLRFWTFIVADAIVTAGRERLEGARWLAAAVFGLLVTVAAAHLAVFTFRYFYHPYFEDVSIPALPYGLALGLILGLSVAVAQLALFPAAERRAGRWALASAVAMPIAILFCSTAINQALDGLRPVVDAHPRVLDVLAIGLGRPSNWNELATQFAAMAASAVLVRALMLRPLRHAH